MDGNEEIARRRAFIDELDQRITGMLNERARHVLEIRRAKEESGIEILDEIREGEIFDKIAAANDGPLSDDDVREIYRRILEVMRSFGR